MLMIFHENRQEGHSWLASETPFTKPREIEIAYRALIGDQRELFDRICQNLPTAESYIREHAQEYGWNEELLNEAKIFVPKQLDQPVPYFEPYWHCFENSFRHAEQTGLLYVEGIAISPAGPQLHAWNSADGTDVLDFTWPFQHVNHYFGIVFEVEWMKENWPTPGGILGYLHEETKAGLIPAPA